MDKDMLVFFGFRGAAIERFEVEFGASLEPVSEWMRDTLSAENGHETAYGFDGVSWMMKVEGAGGAEMSVDARDVPERIRAAAQER